MTTKDKDMSEQSNERELFEAAITLPAGASYYEKHDKYLWDETGRECLLINEIRKTWQAARAPLLARIAELEAKLEAAGKDAERYQWLRNPETSAPQISKIFTKSGGSHAVTLKCDVHLDGTIDAAIRGNE